MSIGDPHLKLKELVLQSHLPGVGVGSLETLFVFTFTYLQGITITVIPSLLSQSSTPASKDQASVLSQVSTISTDKPSVARAKEVQQLKHVLKSNDPSRTLQNAMKLIPTMLETAKTQLQGTSSQQSQVM